jgi:hypothetical protein|tara:strand:+ start:2684 stop:3037 length:354 start_codon:yes stop_codon:yes gene_type:complete
MTDYIFYIYNTEDYKIYNNSFEIKKLKWNYANELVKNNYYSFLFYRYNAESYLSIDIKQAILQKILKNIQNKHNIFGFVLYDTEMLYNINFELDIFYMTLNYNEQVLIIYHKLLAQY